MDDLMRLQKQRDELKKELALLKADFLKITSSISRKKYLAKTYRFIEEYHNEFGLIWLLDYMKVYPNSFYSYLGSKRKRRAHVDIKRER